MADEDVADKKDKASTEALAMSVPDDNHQLRQMVQMLFSIEGYWGAKFFGMIGGINIVMIWVLAKWGVPAILAVQSLYLQVHGDNTKLVMAQLEVEKLRISSQQQTNLAQQQINVANQKAISDLTAIVQAQNTLTQKQLKALAAKKLEIKQ